MTPAKPTPTKRISALAAGSASATVPPRPAPYRFSFSPVPPAAILQDTEALSHAVRTYLADTLPLGPLEISPYHPTPEGLALACGFAGFRHMMSAVKTLTPATTTSSIPAVPEAKQYSSSSSNLSTSQPSTEPQPVPSDHAATADHAAIAATNRHQSIHVLGAACATLQDYYLRHGLSKLLPADLIRFISSAYFNINDKTISDTTTTSTTSHHEQRTITIRLERPTMSAQATQATAHSADAAVGNEINRLMEALEIQTRNELIALNKMPAAATPAAATAATPAAAATVPAATVDDLVAELI